ncbi:MAG: RHS repeat-associated core domain-containing protein [Roseateles sp.]|uniref:RHS repeat domain-containing protein n=1 Tax=Roseateles sp. TaxID=1971397 RepID=UPI0039EB31CA
MGTRIAELAGWVAAVAVHMSVGRANARSKRGEVKRDDGLAARLLAVACMLLPLRVIGAIDMQYLQGQMPMAQKAITPYGDDLMGDKVNLFDGSLYFEQTDLALKGNNELPVALIRGVSPGKHTSAGGYNYPLGDWTWKVPRIGGTFAKARGWRGAGNTLARCSNFWMPENEYLAGLGANIEVFNYTFWQGTHIEVPGEGTQEVLRRDPAYASAPSSGGPYPLVTKGQWQIGCLSTVQNSTGEGFYAISPAGVRYDFDWYAVRDADTMKAGRATLLRQDVYLYASKVTDRFGNWVRYTYDPSDPKLLRRIESSDGRVVTVTNSGGRAVLASDGTRSITYSYSGPTLTSVGLPDGRSWTLNISSLYPPDISVSREVDSCDDGTTPPLGPQSFSGSIIHPSGAVGTFSTSYVALFKNAVGSTCQIVSGIGRYDYLPASVNLALSTKTITGPGLASLQWSFTYSDPWNGGTCGGKSSYRLSTVTHPGGVVNRKCFGNTWHVDEGLLLEEQFGWNGVVPLKRVTRSYRLAPGQAFPTQFGIGFTADRGDWFSALLAPVDSVTTVQQGVSFTYTVNQFDAAARPIIATRSGPTGSRTEATDYHDQPTLWVLGQVQSVSADGWVMQSNGFNALAQRTSHSEFGVLKSLRSYHADGTVASESDGAGHTVYLGNWMRGIPQTVSYPTGASESAAVNNLGLITSFTDAAGFTTGYGYDAMGRLASITPPTGFTGSSLVFEPVGASEYGLPAGHWRQTVTQGAAKTVTYYDALWRAVMTRTYDAGNEANTRKVTVRQYDPDGRPTFVSYPQRDIASVTATSPGTRTSYDALGRATQVQADSELGVLTTTTNYLTGFQTQTTNPRGKVTTQGFWALDDPSQAQLASIAAPAGVAVAISRDGFGKPTAITRSGSHGGYSSSVTRRYVYDAGQLLCKTIEPEVGATVQAYDAAGNVAWKAPGQNLPDTGACDDASVAETAKISYGYDPLNRLTSVSYGDASPGVTRSYTPDGLLESVASAGSAWSYGYNALRKPATETLAYAGQNYNISWGYNAAGHLSTLTYPNGSTVSYSPNALGEAQSVSGYASAVSHHPNGAVAGYQLANGIAHSLTQNTRGLPLVNKDAGVLQDQYSYDANGNVTGITDQQEGVFSRTMGYDELDRLASANAPNVWGNATYAYDAVDNLRAATVGARASSFNFNTNNQLASVTTNGATASYGYDARGNLTAKGAQSFGFDIGNRLNWSSLGGSYAYDGHGRRFKVASSDGSTRVQVYSQAGQLLWATSTGGPRPSSTTAYIYLAGKQIAEVNSASGTQYVHTDALGSPVAHSNASGTVINRSRFEPYGYVAAGTKPSANTSVIGFTGHVQDAETDLVYMQQRYFDPLPGRFLSVDPIVTDRQSGSSFNRYVYGANNPYKFKDPDGRAIETAWDVASLALSIGQFVESPSIGNAIGVVVDAAAVAIPGVPGGVGAVRAAASTANKAADAAKGFASEAKLLGHFEKHGAEFGARSADDYLQVGRDIMQNGTKVNYLYKGETRTGYAQFMGNTSRGDAKFGFVGTNADGAITTIHTQSGKSFWKMLNGDPSIRTITPAP